MNNEWSGPRHAWSGLMADSIYLWQRGLRVVCREVGDFHFHPTPSGYGGYRKVAQWAIENRPKRMMLVGHSNGGYAITSIAEILAPHSIECALVCFDRTKKHCPPLGSNVVAAIDIWAGLKTMNLGPDFKGEYAVHDFHDESHIGVIGNKQAQRIAIDFLRKWDVVLPLTDQTR